MTDNVRGRRKNKREIAPETTDWVRERSRCVFRLLTDCWLIGDWWLPPVTRAEGEKTNAHRIPVSVTITLVFCLLYELHVWSHGIRPWLCFVWDYIAFTHCDDSDAFSLNHLHEANFTHNISDLIGYYKSSVYVHDVTQYNEQHNFITRHIYFLT